VVCVGLALLLSGCGGYIVSARRAYHDGRYLEVAEGLSKHEGEVSSLSHEGQARYGLYRGLSLLRLGDHDAAGKWLELAASIEQKHPGTLTTDEKRELEAARVSLAKQLSEDDQAARASLPTANP